MPRETNPDGQIDNTTETPAPKRRGRPPKAKTEAAAPAPKRRGRPPKAKTEATAPKKPGRPAGVTAAVALRELKARTKDEIKALKAEIRELKADLKAAAQKEARILKAFEKRTKAMTAFAAKWDKDALKEIHSPKKRTRKKRTARTK